MEVRKVVDALAAGGPAPDEELLELVQARDPAVGLYLFEAASRVRRERVGDGVHLRGLIEFSNHCRMDCLYCGLRRSNLALARYRLSPDDIGEAIDAASSIGYRTVVLQSGEDLLYDAELVARLIHRAKGKGLAVTLSLGERDRDELAYWRRQGADRYLLRHETANPELHRQLRPGRSLEGRIAVLRRLKELGYQVGAGFMVGLPGQTPRDLVADLRLLVDLQADMAGIGPFIPHPGTPLAGATGGSLESTLRMVALARLLLPEAMIPATTALGSMDPFGREQGLMAGANVLMPNVTPPSVRPLYQLYPGKICLDEGAAHCRGCTEARIHRIGRNVAAGPGHCPGWERRQGHDPERIGSIHQ